MFPQLVVSLLAQVRNNRINITVFLLINHTLITDFRYKSWLSLTLGSDVVVSDEAVFSLDGVLSNVRFKMESGTTTHDIKSESSDSFMIRIDDELSFSWNRLFDDDPNQPESIIVGSLTFFEQVKLGGKVLLTVSKRFRVPGYAAQKRTPTKLQVINSGWFNSDNCALYARVNLAQNGSDPIFFNVTLPHAHGLSYLWLVSDSVIDSDQSRQFLGSYPFSMFKYNFIGNNLTFSGRAMSRKSVSFHNLIIEEDCSNNGRNDRITFKKRGQELDLPEGSVQLEHDRPVRLFKEGFLKDTSDYEDYYWDDQNPHPVSHSTPLFTSPFLITILICYSYLSFLY